jgi:hypothetical protein
MQVWNDFDRLFKELTDHLKSAPRPSATINRADVDKLLALADDGRKLGQVFQLCCLLRARAVAVDRQFSAAFYSQCAKHGQARLAVNTMASGKRSGLVPTTQGAVWIAMDGLRRSVVSGGDNADADRAINTALRALAELPTYHLTCVDPFLLTQLLALCLRAQTTHSLELFAGFEADLRSVITPWQFGRAYYQTRSHATAVLPLLFDRSLTPVRQYFGDAIAEPDVDEGVIAPEALAFETPAARQRLAEVLVAVPARSTESTPWSDAQLTYWRAVFGHVDKVRQTGQVPGGPRDPDDHRGPAEARRPVLGVERGKYAGPVRRDVPYGTALRRVATIDGRVVAEPHAEAVLARSTKWRHGPRPDEGASRRAMREAL